MQSLLRWSEDRDLCHSSTWRNPDGAVNGTFRSTSSFCMEIVVATGPRGRVSSLGGSGSLKRGELSLRSVTRDCAKMRKRDQLLPCAVQPPSSKYKIDSVYRMMNKLLWFL